MRLVLFLGAGFSRSAGFPLMREFSMFSQELADYEKHIECLHKCIEYAQRTRAYIHGDIHNIEYLMSVLSLAAITNPTLDFRIGSKEVRVAKALEILKELVWRIYSRMDDVLTWEGTYRPFQNALAQLLKGGGCSLEIVTTNYDLLAEMVMCKLGQQGTIPDGFEQIPLPDGYTTGHKLARKSVGDYSLYAQGRGGNLHKLHGSVNWFVSKKARDKGVYCWDQTFSPVDSNRLFDIPFCTTREAVIPDGYSPIIVPPSMIKDYKMPVIEKAWQGASKAIANADKIVFIGYSFPPTDTIMKFFLGTSLANNRKGCRITIIDKNAEEVMNSLRRIFVDDICDRIEPVNGEFSRFMVDAFGSWQGFAKHLSS